MSAFVVGTDCINRSVYGLWLMQMPHEDQTKLGLSLIAMNILAVQQRYPREVIEYDHMATYTYSEPSKVPDCVDAVAAWKALQCLLYQCSEGNVPELALFKQVEEYADKLGEMIKRKRNVKDVWDMPECKNAPWGD
jgi:hypothetical protein